MRPNASITLTLVFATFLLPAGGCILHMDGWWPTANVERTVELEHPLEAGATLAVGTASGSIHLTGQDVDAVHVVATITAHAASEEQAQELAEQVSIGFESSGSRLEIKADRPPQRKRQSISISYQIVAPRQIHVNCNSASGSLNLTYLTGNVEGQTASGSVEAAHITGSVNLRTASGSARCEAVREGDVHLGSASGSVKLSDAMQIGTCDLHAASGSVRATSVEADSIRMRSASGSVTLTDARAQTVDLHSSSGRTTAEQIDCTRLKAESVSGSVSVAFVPAAPGDVVAELSSGSGSVDVTIPPSFAGQVDLSVGSGSIHTDLPLTIAGSIKKKRIRGTVGEGSGRLSARAGSGSIRVR
ncbi:MAG: DUF4097 family beta strand repeat protein [Phycisphaerales bacterium]|nr:MAG: DUF4097 family beta strand repeat protein [Phycisphaerales bacterium]